MSYSASITDLFRRAAIYIDKILKAAKPGDLPVEQPKKFEFIVNLKAAKQIGLTIPPNLRTSGQSDPLTCRSYNCTEHNGCAGKAPTIPASQ